VCDLKRVRRYREVGLWVLVGTTAAVLELLLLRALYEGLGWTLPLATAIAAEVLILAKFAVSDRFVFGYPVPGLARLLKYHGAALGALVVYWLVTNGLAGMGNVAYMFAFVAGTVAAFAWSLLTSFLWVWARPART
jgi:putative flippase GtrA